MSDEYSKAIERRAKQDEEFIRDLEKNARCAVLPSPESISFTSTNLGSDITKTVKDYKDVSQWLKEKQTNNVGFFEYRKQELEKSNFLAMITGAFQFAYDPIRNTKSPELPELVFWYYAGHGLSPKSATELSAYSAIPRLNHNDANTTPEKLKGGELCLHWAGFSNLNGLVKPFIEAVGKDKSNKHLVLVLDSCYSGRFVEDLESLKSQLKNGCTVTVQASCQSQENAIGGFFTRTFLYLNKKKEVLKKLKEKWQKLDVATKESYRHVQVPSPVLGTTRDIQTVVPGDLTLEINEQNLELTLFRDSAFFKFCYHAIFMRPERPLVKDPQGERVMTIGSAEQFLTNQKFIVLDFKLLCMQKSGTYKGYPLGLFLFEDSTGIAVCAHVHFDKNDTSKVGRINFIHHLKSTVSGLLEFEEEDDGGLSRGRYKIPMATVPLKQHPSHKDPSHWFYWKWDDTPQAFDSSIQQNKISISNLNKKNVQCAMQLVKECHSHVENVYPGLWANPGQWNMSNSHMSKFRAGEEDTWMQEYLKRVQGEYGLEKTLPT